MAAESKQKESAQRSAHWYVKCIDGDVGPLTAQQLREMAADGQLIPEDLVSPDKNKWVPAEKVQGLKFEVQGEDEMLAEPAANAESKPDTRPAPSTRAAKHEPAVSDVPQNTAPDANAAEHVLPQLEAKGGAPPGSRKLGRPATAAQVPPLPKGKATPPLPTNRETTPPQPKARTTRVVDDDPKTDGSAPRSDFEERILAEFHPMNPAAPDIDAIAEMGNAATAILIRLFKNPRTEYGISSQPLLAATLARLAHEEDSEAHDFLKLVAAGKVPVLDDRTGEAALRVAANCIQSKPGKDSKDLNVVQQPASEQVPQIAKLLPQGIAVEDAGGGVKAVRCPFCNAMMKPNPELAGRAVSCVKCQKQFRAPSHKPANDSTPPGRVVIRKDVGQAVNSQFREELEVQFASSSGQIAKDVAGGIFGLTIQPILSVVGIVFVFGLILSLAGEEQTETVIRIGITVVIFSLLGGIGTAIYRICSAASRVGTSGLTDRVLNSAAEREQLIHELSRALQDERPEVVCGALCEIARLGPAAARLLPAVAQLAVPGNHTSGADGSTIYIWHYSLIALGAIGPAAIPTIRETLGKEQRKNILNRELGFVKRAKAALETAKRMQPVDLQ